MQPVKHSSVLQKQVEVLNFNPKENDTRNDISAVSNESDNALVEITGKQQ